MLHILHFSLINIPKQQITITPKKHSSLMNKQELALQYFPDATAATAVRHLTRWIARCLPLAEALAQSGYQSRNRTFTWRQVLLIRNFLGEPAVDGHRRT